RTSSCRPAKTLPPAASSRWPSPIRLPPRSLLWCWLAPRSGWCSPPGDSSDGWLNRSRDDGLRSANRRNSMPMSETPLAERIARVLAAAALSSNADGDDPSAGDKVDLAWKGHLNQALAVLHTM